jgi:malonyl-CoA/methylmalonyl-CoA synthetase
MNRNLFARVAANANPDAPLLESVDGRRWRYGEAFALAGRLANALVDLGVGAGDRVAVQVAKSPEALILYLATVRAGAVILPLNPDHTPAELAYFVGDAEPTLIVSDPNAAVAAVAGSIPVVTLDAGGAGSLARLAARQPDAFDTVGRGDDDIAAILYTSGTTGRPKGAMLTHDNLVSNALALVETWRFTADDVLIHALPIFHTHGLFVATNTVLFSGASMLMLPRFDAGAVLALMPRATTLMGVPTFYTRLLRHPGLTRAATAGMRLFVSGSAPLPADTHRAFAEATGHAILERYGMTETNMITSNPYEGARLAGTVGMPLPGVAVRIADAGSGRALEPGRTGVIEVSGPNVFKGYWRMAAKSAAEFRPDGFFVTGDLGAIDGRGTLTIVGRAKDLIISGGLNVYPKEVEDVLDALAGVAESAVIGVPHDDLGEAVVAVVVADGTGAPDEAAILAAVKDQIAGYKRPKRVIIVDELPRNAMGKVQKAVLRERYGGGRSGGEAR